MSTPPTRMLRIRLRSSSSLRRSPASSAVISAEIRSSPGIVAAPRDQRVLVLVELGHRLLDLLALGHQAVRRRTAAGSSSTSGAGGARRRAGRPSPQRSRATGRAWRTARRSRSCPSSGSAVEQLLERTAHRGAIAVDRAWRQGRVDEVAQPAVVDAVDVDDVVDDLLVQRARRRSRTSRAIVSPGKTASLVRRKNSPDSRSSTMNPNGPAASQPSWPLSAGHRLAVALAAQRRVCVVEVGSSSSVASGTGCEPSRSWLVMRAAGDLRRGLISASAAQPLGAPAKPTADAGLIERLAGAIAREACPRRARSVTARSRCWRLGGGAATRWSARRRRSRSSISPVASSRRVVFELGDRRSCRADSRVRDVALNWLQPRRGHFDRAAPTTRCSRVDSRPRPGRSPSCVEITTRVAARRSWSRSPAARPRIWCSEAKT